VYVESQTYDLAWILYGSAHGLLRGRDLDLLHRTVAALVATQHPSGGWPWSDDGCVHEITATELWRLGRREAARAAADWLAGWLRTGRLSPDGVLHESESLHVVKSWGPPEAPFRPFAGEYQYAFHDFPAADEIPLAIRLFELTGVAREDPELMARLGGAVGRMLDEAEASIDARESLDFLYLFGVMDSLRLVEEGLWPADGVWDRGKALLARLARAEAGKVTSEANATAILLRGMVLTGLVHEMPGEADAIVARLLATQDAGGEWLMNPVLLGPPMEGTGRASVVGEVEGLPTVSSAIALEEFARAVIGPVP
jgi:hypothetical protein